MDAPNLPKAETCLSDSHSLAPVVLTRSLTQAGGRPWALVVGPRSLNASMLVAIARLAEGGLVRVLDGGNRFNAYAVARAAGGRPDVLNRITVSRAFTCYQVLSLLEITLAVQVDLQPGREGIPGGTAHHGSASLLRLVALDLLNTFYDESVRAGERKRLLRACILHLERLAGNGGNAISIHPPAVPSQTAVELLDLLKASEAVEPYYIEPENPPPEPLRLF